MKIGIYSLLLLSFIIILLTGCDRPDDIHVSEDVLPVHVSVVTRAAEAIGPDQIHSTRVYLVDPAARTFIKREDAVISPDGTVATIHTAIPAKYVRRQIQAYFISNATGLSDELDMPPGSIFDLSRLTELATNALLHGDTPGFVMSATMTFSGGDAEIPQVRFDRTFAKVYIAPAAEMPVEVQRKIRIVSAEIISASAGGYLFRDGIVPERAEPYVVSVDETVDKLNFRTPLCCLYPDDEGAHLIVTLHDDESGQTIRRRVTLRPQRNTAHKLTITAIAGGTDGGYSIEVSDWDGDILLPETGEGSKPSPPMDEGIDLINNPAPYYYYNTLNEQGKKLYRIIFDEINNATDYQGGEALIRMMPPDLVGVFSIADFRNMYYYLLFDMPALFNLWALTYYSLDSGGKVTSYRFTLHAPRPEYDKRVDLVMKSAAELLSQIPPGLSEFEKVKTTHDLFLRTVTYGGAGKIYGGTILGGLVAKKVVCEGYGATLQYLLQRQGIQALYLSGDGFTSPLNKINHGWIIVRVDSKYYMIDPTWDDSIDPSRPELVYYTYFMKSEATMSKDHRPFRTVPIPDCLEDYPL